MSKHKPYATMTPAERASLEMAMQGLTFKPGAEERILAEGQVMDFLEALHNHMEADGVSQTELARRMHVQKNQIGRWLSTESSLKAETMFALARMMGYELRLEWQAIDCAYQPASQYTQWPDAQSALADEIYAEAA